MSYHIYTTPGIILKRRAFGEADTVLYVLTRDLGLIIASARATRVEASKLRGALQEYSLSSLSLVKGKNSWKITNASLESNFFFESKEFSRRVLAQVSLVLLKTITGEMPHKEIFEIVKTGFESLKDINIEDIPNFEALMVLRVMKELGYVVLDENTEKYLKDGTSWGIEEISGVGSDRVRIVGLINKAIKESQL